MVGVASQVALQQYHQRFLSHGLPTTQRFAVAVSSDAITATTTGTTYDSDADTSFFLLVGTLLVMAMHAGFAFLELGTVRKKNEVNALVKIVVDLALTTIVYYLLGYYIAYDIELFTSSATSLSQDNGLASMTFFFMLTFAAAIPGIISGAIAERATFWGQLVGTTLVIIGVYSVIEGLLWGKRWGFQAYLLERFGYEFHDFAGSVVVHAVGGWVALGACWVLGPRLGRFPTRPGQVLSSPPPSSVPWLSLGTWALIVGWFGFNVMSARSLSLISGLVAVNSLMALAGGILTALIFSRNDASLIHNGGLAGLVAVCAGSDVMHPLLALVTGGVAGAIVVKFTPTCTAIHWRIDDVLAVFPLHGLCGAWGGLAAGIFGLEAFSGVGGVDFLVQLIGTLLAMFFSLGGGLIIYALVHYTIGFRLSRDDELAGCDIAIHRVHATSEKDHFYDDVESNGHAASA